MTGKINKQVYTRYTSLTDFDSEPMSMFIDKINSVMESIPEASRADAKLDVDAISGEYSNSFAVVYYRPETDEEFASRVNNTIKVSEQTTQREIAELKRLIDKYGIPDGK